jgi:hypothetical protein
MKATCLVFNLEVIIKNYANIIDVIIKIYANIIDDTTLVINKVFQLIFHFFPLYLTLVFWSQILTAAVERFAENGLLDPDAIVKTDEDTLANLIKPVSCSVVHLLWMSTNWLAAMGSFVTDQQV